MSDPALLDSVALGRQIADALSLYIGPGKRYTREVIASATGLDARTVKAHCLAETVPSLGAALTYMRVLPPEFADHVLVLSGLGGVRRLDESADAQKTLAEVASGMSALAGALADGRIDHQERAALIPCMRSAATACEHLAATLERGAP